MPEACFITQRDGSWFCKPHGWACEEIAETLSPKELQVFTTKRDQASKAFYGTVGPLVTMDAAPAAVDGPEGAQAPSAASDPAVAPDAAAMTGQSSPWPGPVRTEGDTVKAARPLPGQSQLRPAPVVRHPLAYEAGTLDMLQDALDTHSSGRFVAANPDASFATLTTATSGAPRAWGRNVLAGPRLLSAVAGVPPQSIAAIFAQFPQLTLPTAQPLSAEGVTLVEYASSAAGSVTAGRFGRWTDMSRESLIGADAAAITGMHRVGVALDLDDVLITATETAAGTPVAFDADVPAAIRTAMARVLANTAADDPTALVILAHPDNVALLEDVTPTGGDTIGERFQRFSGALVYPSNSVETGFITVANLMAGARYFEAQGLMTLTDTNIKTGVETAATFIIAGYGVTLTSGFAIQVDVVTP